MNRSPLDRLFALLLAVLFLGSTAGDGFGLDPCPHHAAPAHASAALHGEAGNAHSAHTHDAAPSPADAPADHSGACTCIGACEAGTGAALSAPPLAAVRAHFVVHSPDHRATASSVAPRLLPYFLPYALAPPRHG